MNKTTKWTAGLTLTAAMVLAGCNETQDNTVETEPSESSPVENSELVTPNDYGFTKFDLSIDTADENDVIDVDYEAGRSGMEIEYTNKMEDIRLGGDEAGTQLDPILTDLGLTPDMTKEDAINKVAQAFGVMDYTDFELEVEFEDGQEVEWNDKK
ncbi:YusW family protein [Chryseomicrobium palamuruense]|uniref:YusW family protein n=1 Tax=Chryseomicrobium palamuruense TaxID=682973 RepID=A0ABV8USN7_9BACL